MMIANLQLKVVTANQGKSAKNGFRLVHAQHHDIGECWLTCQGTPELLFTENETNNERLWGVPNRTAFVKDGIDSAIVNKAEGTVNPDGVGTKSLHTMRSQLSQAPPRRSSYACQPTSTVHPLPMPRQPSLHALAKQTNFTTRSVPLRQKMSLWSSDRHSPACSGVNNSTIMMWING